MFQACKSVHEDVIYRPVGNNMGDKGLNITIISNRKGRFINDEKELRCWLLIIIRKKHEVSSSEAKCNSLDMSIFLEFLTTTKLLSGSAYLIIIQSKPGMQQWDKIDFSLHGLLFLFTLTMILCIQLKERRHQRQRSIEMTNFICRQSTATTDSNVDDSDVQSFIRKSPLLQARPFRAASVN